MWSEHSVRRKSTASPRSVCMCVLSLLLLQALAACSEGGDAGPSPTKAGVIAAPPPTEAVVVAAPPPTEAPPSVPPLSASSMHGRFVGTINIDDVDYFADALIAIDGAMRLYVGDPYAPSGALQMARPEGGHSAQFVVNLAFKDFGASGRGVVIPQSCADPVEGSVFCGDYITGEITIGFNADEVKGEITVDVNHQIGHWKLDLNSWDTSYLTSASLAAVAGQYAEELAEFAPDGDMVMSIDDAGRLFFQSAHSGCTGNGTLAPRLDGSFNVYDVSLTVESCREPYVSLNGAYEGLTSNSAGSVWDYDMGVLRTWVSKSDGSMGALVLSGRQSP